MSKLLLLSGLAAYRGKNVRASISDKGVWAQGIWQQESGHFDGKMGKVNYLNLCGK
jgi:hypothetical protein